MNIPLWAQAHVGSRWKQQGYPVKLRAGLRAFHHVVRLYSQLKEASDSISFAGLGMAIQSEESRQGKMHRAT